MAERERGPRTPAAPSAPRVQVKICGVTRAEDAAVAVSAGASFVGAILSPGFRRSVAPEAAASYPLALRGARGDATARALRGASGGSGRGGGARLVAVLVDPTPQEAVAVAATSGAGVVQLHGEESAELIAAIRESGDWEIWKAVRVETEDDVLRAVDLFGAVADGVLFDGGARGAKGGGHGVEFPWTALADARERIPPDLKVIAAGGLRPENVGEAVRTLRPHVVDVSSGVEEAVGIKDGERVVRFIREATESGGQPEPRNAARPVGS